MVAQQTGRYSKYIRPINVLFDLTIITGLSLFFFRDLKLNFVNYLLYQTFVWLFISFVVKFYDVYRFTTPVEIISKTVNTNYEPENGKNLLSMTYNPNNV